MADVTKFNLFGQDVFIRDTQARTEIDSLRVDLDNAVKKVEDTVSPSNWIGYNSFWFNGTFVQKITIPRNRVKIATYATNGNPSSPFTGNRLSVLNTAIREQTIAMINGALSGTTIIGGVVNTDRRESGEAQYYLSFTESGEYSFTSNLGSNKPTGTMLLAQGPYCLGMWCPIVTGGTKFDYNSSEMQSDPNYEYIVVQRHPRQVLAFTADNIYIYSCMGRNPANKGFNYDDLATLMLQERVDDAFNLDGGGSTDTVVDYHRMFPDIDKGYVGGRIGFETIGFKEV